MSDGAFTRQQRTLHEKGDRAYWFNMTGIEQKWRNLLATLEVLEGEQDILSEEDLRSFEIVPGITLPNEYKAFCRFIGSGVFGDYLSVYCPPIDQLETPLLREALEDSADLDGSEFSYRIMHGESLDLAAAKVVLESAFIFGRSSGGEIFLWDLRTYSELDSSYDICITRLVDFPGVYKVGRDFFEFIQTFGIGIKNYASFPEWIHPSFQEFNHTFTPISPNLNPYR